MNYHDIDLSNDPTALLDLLHIGNDDTTSRPTNTSNDPKTLLNRLHIDNNNNNNNNNSTSRPADISNSNNMPSRSNTPTFNGATLTCDCGETVLRFDNRVPRATIECCCDDCYARLEHCARLGGPALEHGIYERTRPVRLVYFDNRLSIIKGRHNLRFFKLAPTSVVNMSTSCCRSFLLKECERLPGTVVAIEQDYGNDDNADLPLKDHQPRPVHHRTNLHNVQHQEAMLRAFPNDWLLEHISYLKPLPSFWFDEAGNVVGQPKGSWEETFDEYMDKVTAAVPPMQAGVEFGVLMGEDHELEIVSEKVFTDAGAVGEATKTALAQ